MSSPTTTLERQSRVTPFGVKFWDAAVRRPVVSGLSVAVYPVGDPQRRVSAFVNRVGTFFLPRLPGPRDPEFDFGSGDPDFWARVYASPRATYAIEVVDTLGQYQPFRFTEPLPIPSEVFHQRRHQIRVHGDRPVLPALGFRPLGDHKPLDQIQLTPAQGANFPFSQPARLGEIQNQESRTGTR